MGVGPLFWTLALMTVFSMIFPEYMEKTYGFLGSESLFFDLSLLNGCPLLRFVMISVEVFFEPSGIHLWVLSAL